VMMHGFGVGLDLRPLAAFLDLLRLLLREDSMIAVYLCRCPRIELLTCGLLGLSVVNGHIERFRRD